MSAIAAIKLQFIAGAADAIFGTKTHIVHIIAFGTELHFLMMYSSILFCFNFPYLIIYYLIDIIIIIIIVNI